MSIAAKRLHGSCCQLIRGRPRPRLHCVRWAPSASLPKKGLEPSPQFSAHVRCRQRLERSRWHLAWKWVLAHATLFGPSSPSPKRDRAKPNFQPFIIVAKRLDASRCHLVCLLCQMAGWIKMAVGMEVGLSPDDFMLGRDPAPSPQKGGETSLPISAQLYCGQTAGCIQMPLGMEVGLSLGSRIRVR